MENFQSNLIMRYPPPPPFTTRHRHIHDIQLHQIWIEHQQLSTYVSEFCCLSGWNYPLAGLCQDLVSIHLLWLLFCKLLRGAVEVDQFRVWPTWEGGTMPGQYKACEIDKSVQQVHLQLLLHLEFRVQFWLLHSCV